MSALFDGVWDIDLEGSSMWDLEQQRYVPEPAGFERITLRHDGATQNYEVLYGDSPRIRMGYTQTFDSTDWAPYQVREIMEIPAGSDAADAALAFGERVGAPAAGVRRRSFAIGSNYGMIRLISVNERVHYRLGVNADDGTPQSMLMRKLEEDGNAYITYLLDPEGIVYRIRRFVRVDS
jgi:hypothetical protein